MRIRIERSIALATAIAAFAAPSALAAPAEQILGDTNDTPASSYSSANSIVPPEPSNSSAPVSTASAGDGFDWGDAAIGATAALAVGAMALGSALVLRPRRGGSVA